MMNATEYKQQIKKFGIEPYGFDTHARVLGIERDHAKKLWNEATHNHFKRVPRTEYFMRYRPEISTKFRPYWELIVPDESYLMFYMTPTTPIIVPHGFITDKGSIPLLFQNLISNYDKQMMMAFLVHDLECEMKRMTRFTTDGLLYEVGTEMGANWIKLNIVYSAVRAAAWRTVPDRVINGLNVSRFNRDLIAKAEQEYVQSKKYAQHLDFIENHHLNHAKINL